MRGEVEPVGGDSRGAVPFTAESGRLASRARADQAKLLREARRQAVEEYLAGKMTAAMALLVSQVDAAESEQAAADAWNAEYPGERKAPDKDVMNRGQRAAESIIERLAGKVSQKLEGEVTHTHLFEMLAAVRQGRG